jgi:hypothetical protein
MWSKTYAISVSIALVAGMGIGYFCTSEKIVTKVVHSEEDSKTIEDLKTKLKQKTQTQTRTIYTNGVIASVDTSTTVDTDQDTDKHTTIDDKKKVDEKTVTEINKKRYIAEIGYETNKHVYLHSIIPLFSVFALGCNVSTNLHDSTSLGVGVAIKF